MPKAKDKSKPRKHEKPVVLDMDFDEAMGIIATATVPPKKKKTHERNQNAKSKKANVSNEKP